MSWQIWRRTWRCTCFEADMEEDEETYLEADIEEDEEMYLLGGRYEGGRGDIPAWRQI